VSENAGDKSNEAGAGGSETAESAPQPPTPPKPRSTVWLQVLLGLAILLSGIAIGTGSTLLVGRRLLRPEGRPASQVSGAIAKQAARRLRLTPQQERDVRRIVREHMDSVNATRSQALQDIDTELTAMREEVAQTLTPQQAQAWRRQFDRLRRIAPQPPDDRRPPPGRSEQR